MLVSVLSLHFSSLSPSSSFSPLPHTVPFCLCQTHFMLKKILQSIALLLKGLAVMYYLSVEGVGGTRVTPNCHGQPMSDVVSDSPHTQPLAGNSG